jgi:alkylation response protein AidB-like acyl-CoA dehydrogenase
VEGIIESISAVAPKLAAHADEIAAARRLTPEVVEMLRAAGAFRIAAPRALGGPELSPREQTEIVEMLSYHEPSIGWCVMIGSDWPYYGSFLAPDAVEELWPSLDAITAGHVPPTGRARPVDDGYLVSGRWPFGSGATHADVIVGGCLVMDGDAPRFVDGRPDFVVACAPASSWHVLDTWFTTGLAGSGSTDYLATDLFVPARNTFRLTDPPRRPEPLYRFPGMFFANMSGVALGIGRRAIDVTLEIAQSKLLLPELALLRDTPRARTVIAHGEAAFGAARAYVYESLDRLWAELLDGDMPSHDTRVALALSRSNALRCARDVTREMCDLVGASSVYASHPLERLQRDAITLCQHIVAQERMYEMIGQLHLTGEGPLPIL